MGKLRTRREAGDVRNTPVRRATAVTLACLVAVGAVAAGCGGGDDSAGANGTKKSKPPSGSPHSAAPPHHEGSHLNDPSATPASDLPGAKQASFVLLETRPPGSDAVTGTAWLAQSGTGTTLTVTMTGLPAGGQYLGHLHALPCATENGGPHFRFNPSGSDQPPNEVHIGFASDPGGKATATITNDRQVGTGARSVVIHPADAVDNRLACADF